MKTATTLKDKEMVAYIAISATQIDTYNAVSVCWNGTALQVKLPEALSVVLVSFSIDATVLLM